MTQGVNATSSAATPDGMRCTASATEPLPAVSSVPTTAWPFHGIARGSGTDRHAAMAKSRMPEKRYRTPATATGGMVSTAKRMNRYVDPQIR